MDICHIQAALHLLNSLSRFDKIPTLQVLPPTVDMGTPAPSLPAASPSGKWPRLLQADPPCKACIGGNSSGRSSVFCWRGRGDLLVVVCQGFLGKVGVRWRRVKTIVLLGQFCSSLRPYSCKLSLILSPANPNLPPCLHLPIAQEALKMPFSTFFCINHQITLSMLIMPTRLNIISSPLLHKSHWGLEASSHQGDCRLASIGL